MLKPRFIVNQRGKPERNSKDLSKFLKALAAKGVMSFAGGLSDLRTDVLNISRDGFCNQFRVVVLHEPVHPDIVTVVLLHDKLTHFPNLK
jgi:hypothetical protein